MCAFLKITHDYAVSPDSRAFMIHGTVGHKKLEIAGAGDESSELEMKFQAGDITGITDGIETENNYRILYDSKTSGSYKVAKALGFYVDEEPTGEIYKSGKQKGQPKTRKILKRDDSRIDIEDWLRQLNKYRIEYEKETKTKINELRIQCVVRDGNTYIARQRGVFRNVYYFRVAIIPDKEILDYFEAKKNALEKALADGYCNEVCSSKENWDGLKCQNYCEVAEFCKYGRYLKREKEVQDMAIKGLSEVRRLPRLGKIRLGIKKIAASGKEYPAEVNYFILAPETPVELENKKLIEEFTRLYGEQPKTIKIMFPVANPDIYFPQFYKRYGSSTSLKCKGNGETASCATDAFAEGLEKVGTDELGLPIVKCKGKDCIYYGKECSEVGVLQILLPDLPGAGVWQISTGSFNSIVNVNSCIDYIIATCGRAHMIPLSLERREQEIVHNGKKTKHYILHINMDFRLADLQKWALIEPTRMLLELPAPETTKEDIVFQENAAAIDVKAEPVTPEPEPKTEGKEDPALPDNNVQKSKNTVAILKKQLSGLMRGMSEATKIEFFGYVVTDTVTVEKLDKFLTNFTAYKTAFLKMKEAQLEGNGQPKHEKKTKEKPDEEKEMAPSFCPNSEDDTVYTKEHCDTKCRSRIGCPVWD
jgi:hypothetical protein